MEKPMKIPIPSDGIEQKLIGWIDESSKELRRLHKQMLSYEKSDRLFDVSRTSVDGETIVMEGYDMEVLTELIFDTSNGSVHVSDLGVEVFGVLLEYEKHKERLSHTKNMLDSYRNGESFQAFTTTTNHWLSRSRQKE
jgi:hypothetical protein